MDGWTVARSFGVAFATSALCAGVDGQASGGWQSTNTTSPSSSSGRTGFTSLSYELRVIILVCAAIVSVHIPHPFTLSCDSRMKSQSQISPQRESELRTPILTLDTSVNSILSPLLHLGISASRWMPRRFYLL